MARPFTSTTDTPAPGIASENQIHIQFRVRIGVTGHRDVIDDEAVTAAVRGHLGVIKQRFSGEGATHVSFIVLTSLAEGADRLVAREAVDVLSAENIELAAVLPMPEHDYQQDFKDPNSRREFREFLRHPTKKLVMPRARDRTEAYDLAGRYVVDHSDIVIALWDGHPPGGQGGTAEIVAYARHQRVPVLLVSVRRAGKGDRVPRRPEWAAQPWNVPAATLESYQRVEEFNKASTAEHEVWQQIDREEERFGAAAAGSAIHWQYEVVANWALPRLVRADALALKYQRWYYRMGAALYVLAALAVTSIAAQSQAGWNDLLSLVEVGFMLALLATYAIARRLRVHERWVGYRSLAEAFRSALFIVLSGARRPEAEGARGELYATDEPWFQRAFTEAWTQRPNVEPADESASQLRQFLIDAWLEDQIAYHRKAVQRSRRGRTWLTRAIFVLFGATVVIALLRSFDALGGGTWRTLLVFLGISLPALGAALVGVRDQHQFRVHEDRSNRTANRLERLRRDMESQTTLPSVQNLTAQIQTVVEAENVDWSGVIEFQDLEMVM